MAEDAKEDPKANIRRINDQSILIQNIQDLAKEERYVSIDTGPLVVGVNLEEPETSINRLFNYEEFIAATDLLTPADMSNLVPYINLYKIYPEKDNMPMYHIPFNNFFPKDAIDSIMADGSDRGYQANLTAVKFISQGKDTATTHQYTVRISFIFDSVQTIFNAKSRYIELFNPPKRYRDNVRDLNPEYYRILLKFGWNANTDYTPELQPVMHSRALRAFADAANSDVYLNYTKHSLVINEDGSVSLDVEYIGAVEALSRNGNETNVFSTFETEELKKKQEQIDIIESNLRNSDSNLVIVQNSDNDRINITIMSESQDVSERYSSDRKELEDLYNAKSNAEANSRSAMLSTLIDKISEQYNYVLPYISINKDEYDRRNDLIEQFSSLSQSDKLDSYKSITSTAKSAVLAKRSRKKRQVKNQNILSTKDLIDDLELQEDSVSYNIRYFTFGTMLKALTALGTFGQEYLFITTNCKMSLFGDGDFISGKQFAANPDYKIYIDNGAKIDDKMAILKNEVFNINIMNIPIALSTFKYWYTKTIMSQNLTTMTLNGFLNSCINELLVLAVKSNNSDYIPKQNIRFKFFYDTVDLATDNDVLGAAQRIAKAGELSTQFRVVDVEEGSNINFADNVMGTETVKKNIVIIYCEPTFVTRKKDLRKDTRGGIPHFFYGAANNIANKITFREENIPFYKEANIQSQVDTKPWKPGVFLRGKYNVLIETIGTVNYRIGSMFYVSPSFTGVIDVEEPLYYGIGGYFSLVSIKFDLEAGKYITTLEGNWVATGTGEYTDLSHKGFTLVRLSKPLETLQSEKEVQKAKLSDAEFNKREIGLKL